MKEDTLLLNPVTTKKEYISSESLAEILECSVANVMNSKYKKRFHKGLNLYILPATTKQSDISKLINGFCLDDEIWKHDKSIGETILFSNYGRVAKINLDGSKRIYFLHEDKSRRTMICRITPRGGKRREIIPHRYVAKLFLNKGKDIGGEYMVIHKNGIKWDGRVGNLAIVKRSKWVPVFAKKSNKNKYVAKIDPFTNEIIDAYVSYNEAARMNHISAPSISEAIKRNKEPEFARFKWKQISEDEYYDIKERNLCEISI